MYSHIQNLILDIAQDEPDPTAANALQEGLGGQFGEMRTMMQYLFQSMNFRGPAAKPHRDRERGRSHARAPSQPWWLAVRGNVAVVRVLFACRLLSIRGRARRSCCREAALSGRC
jgi:hypothetical protein